MTETERIISAVWLDSRRQGMLAAELGMSGPALSSRALTLLRDPAVEARFPVLVHRARETMEARRRGR